MKIDNELKYIEITIILTNLLITVDYILKKKLD